MWRRRRRGTALPRSLVRGLSKQVISFDNNPERCAVLQARLPACVQLLLIVVVRKLGWSPGDPHSDACANRKHSKTRRGNAFMTVGNLGLVQF